MKCSVAEILLRRHFRRETVQTYPMEGKCLKFLEGNILKHAYFFFADFTQLAVQYINSTNLMTRSKMKIGISKL